MSLKIFGRLLLFGFSLLLPIYSQAFGDQLSSGRAIQYVVSNLNLQKFSSTGAVQNIHTRDLFGADTEFVALIQRDANCPIGARSTPYIKELLEKKIKGVQFYLINYQGPGQDKAIRQDFQQNNFKTPYLYDHSQELARILNVETTTEMIVLDRDFAVRYRGPVNNRFTIGATKQEYQDLLGRFLSGAAKNKDIPAESHTAPGCFLALANSTDKVAGDKNAIPWSEIKPLVTQKCILCHRTGDLSGITLNSLADFAKHARLSQFVVEKKIMPPMDINKDSLPVKVSYNLTDKERAQILSWLKNLPANHSDHTPIVEPPEKSAQEEFDYNMSLLEGIDIPEKGYSYYKLFYVKSPFDTDKYITASEMEIDNQRSTHHVIIRIIDHPPKIGQDPLSLDSNYLGGYAPGTRLLGVPDHASILFPKGSYLFVMAHFSPNGQKHKNSLRIKLKFTDDPVRQKNLLQTVALLKQNFVIPKNERMMISDEFTAPYDLKMQTLFPHFHYRGKKVRVWLRKKDSQKRKLLLGLDTFYYHNQIGYDFVNPVSMKKGDKLDVEFYYDNTADNVFNPNPNVDVLHGLAAINEMFYFTMRWVRE